MRPTVRSSWCEKSKWDRARKSRNGGTRRSTQSARQPWMKHQRKRLRAQGVAEIQSQIAEATQQQMFERLAFLSVKGRLTQRQLQKDRDFTAWWDHTSWYDEIRQELKAREYDHDLIEELRREYWEDELDNLSYYERDDDYEGYLGWDDGSEHDDPQYEFLAGVDYGRQEQAIVSIVGRRDSDSVWRILSIDDIHAQSTVELEERIYKTRRYWGLYGGRPSQDKCSSLWKMDWLLGFVDDDFGSTCEGDAIDAYHHRDWEELEGEEEFFEGHHVEWIYSPRCEPLGLASERHFERVKVMRRIHRSSPLRGRKAA